MNGQISLKIKINAKEICFLLEKILFNGINYVVHSILNLFIPKDFFKRNFLKITIIRIIIFFSNQYAYFNWL